MLAVVLKCVRIFLICGRYPGILGFLHNSIPTFFWEYILSAFYLNYDPYQGLKMTFLVWNFKRNYCLKNIPSFKWLHNIFGCGVPHSWYWSQGVLSFSYWSIRNELGNAFFKQNYGEASEMFSLIAPLRILNSYNFYERNGCFSPAL